MPATIAQRRLMPHVMRYMERTKADRMAILAEATGSRKDAAVDVRGLIALLGLPQHIAQYGIGERELRRAADELAGRLPAKDLLEIYMSAL